MISIDVVFAHAKWFVDGSMPFPPDWRFMIDPASLVLIGAAGVLAGGWLILTRWAGIPDLPDHRLLERLRRTAPRLVAGSLGVTLVSLAVTNHFLAPNLPVGEVTLGWALALIEAAVGVWLIAGTRLRGAAVAVELLAVIGLALYGPVAVLECAYMWGIAWFLRVACDHVTSQTRLGLLGLRLGLGVALVAGAVSEKLADPAIMASVLQTQPMIAPRIAALGLGMAMFIRLIGACELLFGLLIMTGATPRLVACIAAVPFLVTVPVFGRIELIGHLPIYGALLVVLVHGSTNRPQPRIRLSRRAVRAWSRRAAVHIGGSRPAARRPAAAGQSVPSVGHWQPVV
jgi:uncharacterized membrane protein YphA (DoxX/SURF4 family)